MPEAADQAAWDRLGELLERARVQMDTRYRNLTLFTQERGVDYRVAWDIEHARRTNFRRPMLTAIEVAYGWRPGSIRQVLAGGDPETELGTDFRGMSADRDQDYPAEEYRRRRA